jgi:hypothetical protein
MAGAQSRCRPAARSLAASSLWNFYYQSDKHPEVVWDWSTPQFSCPVSIPHSRLAIRRTMPEFQHLVVSLPGGVASRRSEVLATDCISMACAKTRWVPRALLFAVLQLYAKISEPCRQETRSRRRAAGWLKANLSWARPGGAGDALDQTPGKNLATEAVCATKRVEIGE